MATLIDLTGNTYGLLTVTEHLGVRGRRVHYWKCECACGGTSEVSGGNLKKGSTKSCGCLNVASERNKKHGMSNSTEYHIWNTMKSRCTNPNKSNYHNYGGRGISYSNEWASFENFYKDMGSRPDGMSLDRIDNDGDYSPENCRWATQYEQDRNTRVNRHITFKGKTMIMQDWADQLSISVQGLKSRIDDLKWPLERALTELPRGTTL